MINATYIRDPASIPGVRDEILAAPVLGIDTETTGFDPHTKELRLIQVATGPERVVMFDKRYIPSDELGFLWDIFADESKVKIFQNGKFDIKFFLKHTPAEAFPTIFDTYLASVLIACGDNSVRHGLGELAQNFCGIELNKEEGSSDFGADILSENQLNYAARDAPVLFPIMEKQKHFLRALDLERCALLEFDCVEAVADLELRGIYVDQAHWNARCARQQILKIDLAGQLTEFFRPVAPVNLFDEVEVNLDSPVELLPYLKRLGVPLTDTTLEGEIKQYVDTHPVIKALIDYREQATALKMFGPEYISDYIHPVTGRIHPEFRQIGTPTGRFTCNNPNLQQIPGENEYRNSYRAADGKKLIIADYSMIELRIMAQFSRDPRLLEAFQKDIDLHQYTGSQAFGLPLEAAAKGTKQRQIGKMSNFAATYGTGAERFSKIGGLSKKKSQEVLDAFWALYGGLDGYMQGAAARAVEEHEVRSYSGRTWRLDYDPTDRKSIGQVERIGRNFAIQATCSDMMKRAMYLMRKKFRGRDAGLVNIVHDEAVPEVPDAFVEEAKEIVQSSMMSAAEDVLSLVPAKVDMHVSPMWLKG